MKNHYENNVKSITVAEWTEIWLGTYETAFSRSTYNMYRDTLKNHILPHLGAYNLSEVCTAHIQELVNSNVRTSLKIVAVLTHMFEPVIDTGLITEEPCDDVMYP